MRHWAFAQVKKSFAFCSAWFPYVLNHAFGGSDSRCAAGSLGAAEQWNPYHGLWRYHVYYVEICWDFCYMIECLQCQVLSTVSSPAFLLFCPSFPSVRAQHTQKHAILGTQLTWLAICKSKSQCSLTLHCSKKTGSWRFIFKRSINHITHVSPFTWTTRGVHRVSSEPDVFATRFTWAGRSPRSSQLVGQVWYKIVEKVWYQTYPK